MQLVSEIKCYNVKENEDQNGLQKIQKQFESYIFQVEAGSSELGVRSVIQETVDPRCAYVKS